MSDHKLFKTLSKASKLLRWSEITRAGATAVTLLIFLALAIVAIDVALMLPVWGLWIADIILISIALSSLIWVYWVSYANRFDSRKIARRLENCCGLKHSEIINAVDLLGSQNKSTSPALRDYAIQVGANSASTLNHKKIVDFRKLKHSVSAAGFALALLCICAFSLNDVFAAVIPRLLSPNSAHPAYTLVNFEVKISPNRIYQKMPATISARLTSSGNMPTKANIVFVDSKNQLISSMPMVRKKTDLFELKLDQALHNQKFYVYTPAGRSKYYNLRVHQMPEIKFTNLRRIYPQYTNWAASKELLKPQQPIRVLRDTELVFTVNANTPIVRGFLRITPRDKSQAPREIPLAPDQSQKSLVAKACYKVTTNADYELRIFNKDNVTPYKYPAGEIVCLSDKKPAISIVAPDPNLQAPENWKVKVKIEARDDVSIESIRFFRAVNNLAPIPVDLEFLPGTGPTATAEVVFDLQKLGAKAGDIISYFATTRDNYPANPHISETQKGVIRVISIEDYAQKVRKNYRMERIIREMEYYYKLQQKVEKLRNELKTRVKKLDDKIKAQDGKLTKADHEELDKITKLQKDYIDAMNDLSKELRDRIKKPDIWEIDEEYKKTLEELADNLDNQAEGSKVQQQIIKQNRKSPNIISKYLKGTMQQLDNDQQTQQEPMEHFQKAQLDLKLLAKADHMISLVERLNDIVTRQRKLTDRLSEFRNKEKLSPSEEIRAQSLGKIQTLLNKEFSELLKEMAKSSIDNEESLPKMSASLTSLVNEIATLEVEDYQKQTARLANAGEGRYAHQAAEYVAGALESLYKNRIQQLGDGQGMAQNDLDQQIGLFRKNLSKMLSQMNYSKGLKPGQGLGQGTGSGVGSGNGSKTKMQLVGPMNGGSGKGNPRDGYNSGRTSGSHSGGQSQDAIAGDASHINSGKNENLNQNSKTSAPQNTVKYKDQIEAYYRRLADESE